MIRVAIVEDHLLVRDGLKALLEKDPSFEICGEGSDGMEAVELARSIEPDVIVMDIAMPKLNGTQATQKIRSISNKTQVVILTMYAEPGLVQQTLQNGAKGYVLKKAVTEELFMAIKAAYRGKTFLSPAVSDIVVDRFLKAPMANGNLNNVLSPRELEVLQLIAEGHTNASIAETLTISVKTVEKHRASLMSKSNVRDTAGLIKVAIKMRLVFIEDENRIL